MEAYFVLLVVLAIKPLHLECPTMTISEIWTNMIWPLL
jgi:hypothetical protein